MHVELTRDFRFEAAHRLPNVPSDHKCSRLHGHSFKCAVYVTGPVNDRLGWVMDFADIKAAFAPIERQLDHNYLNEVDGLSNPTSEVIAKWIWTKLKPSLPSLTRIVVRETCTSGCDYRGD